VGGALVGGCASIGFGFIDALVFSFLCFDFVRKAEFDQAKLRKEAAWCGVWVMGICLLSLIVGAVISQSIDTLVILGIPELIAMLAIVTVNGWVASWFLKKSWLYLFGPYYTAGPIYTWQK
jgi:hypothetical protein